MPTPLVLHLPNDPALGFDLGLCRADQHDQRSPDLHSSAAAALPEQRRLPPTSGASCLHVACSAPVLVRRRTIERIYTALLSPLRIRAQLRLRSATLQQARPRPSSHPPRDALCAARASRPVPPPRYSRPGLHRLAPVSPG